jgi:hypothetical protein
VEKHGECVKQHGPDALWVSFWLLYPFDMQAKELREQLNEFLDEELMAKVSALLEEQHNNAEIVADLRSKLAEVSTTFLFIRIKIKDSLSLHFSLNLITS